MSLDGTWNVTVNTPMGAQKSTLTLKTEGGTITGSQQSPMGAIEIKDGKVDGNTATWSAQIQQPMPMTLEFTVTADGDNLTGGVKAGPFGTSALTGTRA